MHGYIEDGERVPPCSPAEAGAAAMGVLDDGERAPPGCSAQAGVVTMGGRDDSAAQYPGSWSRKGGAGGTGSHVDWGAGWPAERLRHWRAPPSGQERLLERILWRA